MFSIVLWSWQRKWLVRPLLEADNPAGIPVSFRGEKPAGQSVPRQSTAAFGRPRRRVYQPHSPSFSRGRNPRHMRPGALPWTSLARVAMMPRPLLYTEPPPLSSPQTPGQFASYPKLRCRRRPICRPTGWPDADQLLHLTDAADPGHSRFRKDLQWRGSSPLAYLLPPGDEGVAAR